MENEGEEKPIERKNCSACAEEILAAAKKCKHCGTIQPVEREKVGAVAGGVAGGCLGYSVASFVAVFGILAGLLISALGLPIVGLPLVVCSIIAVPLGGMMGGLAGAGLEAKGAGPGPAPGEPNPEPGPQMSMSTALLGGVLGCVVIFAILMYAQTP